MSANDCIDPVDAGARISTASVVVAVTAPKSLRLFGNRLHQLSDAGIRLHVVVGEGFPAKVPELPDEAIVHVVRMKRSVRPHQDVSALVRMAQLLRVIRPQMVVGATPKASLIALLGARIARVPVRIWEVWGAKWDGASTPISRALRAIDRLIARSSTLTVAASQSLADLLVSNRIVKEKPLVVANGSTHGVDTTLFNPEGRSDRAGPLTVGFVGRLSADKGVKDIFEMASQLRSELGELRLLLVGEIEETDPPSGDVQRALESETWVTVTGWVEDTSRYFREIDVLVFPSRREGLPNVLLEAAASGVPSVAYAVTGSVDAVSPGVSGFLVPVGNVSDLTDKVGELLRSPHLRQKMASSARSFVVTHFSSEHIEAEWTSLYLNQLR